MVFFSNASSNFRKGGLTNRGGSNTEDIMNGEAPITSTNQKPGWWQRAKGWFGNNAETIGKVAGGAASFGAAAGDAFTTLMGGKPFVSKLVSGLKEGGKDLANDSSGFGKFMKGFTNKDYKEKGAKMYDAIDNHKGTERLSKIVDAAFAKAPNQQNLVNRAINASNGHVAQGYPSASVQSPVKTTTATSLKATKFVNPTQAPNGQIGNVKPYYVPPSIGGRNPHEISEAIANEWKRWKKYKKEHRAPEDEEKMILLNKLRKLKKKKGKKGKKSSKSHRK